MPQRQKTMNYILYLMYLLQKFSDIQGIRDQGIKNGDRVLGSRHDRGRAARAGPRARAPAVGRNSAVRGPTSCQRRAGGRRAVSWRTACERRAAGVRPVRPACGRHATGDRPACGRRAAGMRTASGRHAAGIRPTCGRRAAGERPACGRHVAGMRPTWAPGPGRRRPWGRGGAATGTVTMTVTVTVTGHCGICDTVMVSDSGRPIGVAGVRRAESPGRAGPRPG
jgi:hypothetical protein